MKKKVLELINKVKIELIELGNSIKTKPLTYFTFSIVIISFIAGWLFPVEGPFDYVYDDYVTYTKIRHNKGVAAPKPKKEIFILDEEMIEQYYLVPKEFD